MIMAVTASPNIVTSGLTMALDVSNIKSYPGTGTLWRDLVGGNNGTLTNGPTFGQTSGGILNFDGTNDYASTSYDLSWNNTNSVTIEFYARPASLSVYYPILGKGPTNWEWQFNQDSTSLGFVYWNTGGGHTNGPTITIANVFNSTTTFVSVSMVWNHVDNKYYFYRNGVWINTTNWTDASINQNRTDGFNIGGNVYQWATGGNYWPGSLAGLRVYSRALSSDEVLQNFDSTKGRFGY